MIELVDYKVVLRKSIYAELSIYIPKFDLEIAKCREFRLESDKGARRWFAFPSYWMETVDEKGFKPMIKFRFKSTEDALWDQVRIVVDKYLDEHPEVEIKPVSFATDGPVELPF